MRPGSLRAASTRYVPSAFRSRAPQHRAHVVHRERPHVVRPHLVLDALGDGQRVGVQHAQIRLDLVIAERPEQPRRDGNRSRGGARLVPRIEREKPHLAVGIRTVNPGAKPEVFGRITVHGPTAGPAIVFGPRVRSATETGRA